MKSKISPTLQKFRISEETGQSLEGARDRLDRWGLIIDDELVDGVLARVKGRRMRRAEAGMAEQGVWLSHENFRRLSMREEDVVQIAESIANSRPMIAGREANP